MYKDGYIRTTICCLAVMALLARNHAVIIDIKTKGATGDGATDDGPAIMSAWKEACDHGASLSTVLIPPGLYKTHSIVLSGPCKGPIELHATGATLKAPPELAKFNTSSWIVIRKVNRFTLTGGTFDGQGHQTWNSTKCHDSLMTCEIPVNLRLSHTKNSLFRDFTSANSKNFHIALWGCDNSSFVNVTISAPGDSVNTDGIHIARLNGLNITNSSIKTGDDCISFGDGSKNVRIEKVTCGPGHGISIGSLGKFPNEQPLQGVWVKNCTFAGTNNGVRIKSWLASYPGIASDIHFEDIIMNKVGNPILIDQEYCPHDTCKKDFPSKVKVSNVSFRKIRGTSTTKVAMKFACSPEAPCDNVQVANINLTFRGPGGRGPASSMCLHVKPKVAGHNVPEVCPGMTQPFDLDNQPGS